ncbi:MAG: hypothetical protein D3922_11185 [Candidatus Electrothrix sp. AR1]|nr:hypothetical protein [Candidatus Electrothrix sp. AR1]
MKNACYDERNEEIEKCREGNRQRKELAKKDIDLTEEKAKDSGVNKDKRLLGYALTSLKGALQMENCNNLVSHCDNKYKESFVSVCGGRIE